MNFQLRFNGGVVRSRDVAQYVVSVPRALARDEAQQPIVIKLSRERSVGRSVGLSV